MRVNYAGWPDEFGDLIVPDPDPALVSPNWNGEAWVEKEPSDVDRAIAAANAAARKVTSVSMRQAELELLDTPFGDSNLLNLIEGFIPTLDRRSQIEWRRAKDVERTHPLIAVVQQMCGISDQQMDELFERASKR